MREKLNRITLYIWRAISSRLFFITTLGVAVVQGLWYALSFKSGVYDEERHFNNIDIYAHRISPFFSEQNPAWDTLGAITRDGSYLFYYAMSWPLRLIQLFTDSQMVQYIGLRIVCIAVFVLGVIIMRKALLETGRVSKGVANFTFLLFILTPATGFLAGIINYDGLSTLLFAVLLLLGVRIVNKVSQKKEKAPVDLLILLVVVGLTMSIVKWTSIALCIPVFLFIGWVVCRRYGRKTLSVFWTGVQSLPRKKLILLTIALAVSVALFIERPVANVVVYGSPSPACNRIIGDARCQNFRDYVAYQGAERRAVERHSDPDYETANLVQFIFIYWIPKMVSTMTNLLETNRSQLPVAVTFYYTAFVVSIIALLVALRELLKSRIVIFLLLTVVGYVAILILQEYSSYLHYASPAAIRARYLAPVLPIYIALSLMSINILFGRYKTILMVLMLATPLLLSQGGGITTHLLKAQPSAYWNEDTRLFNYQLKETLQPLIKER